MSIHYNNVKIYSVRTQEGSYNEKKKKYIKFKEPKIIKKELFNDDCYDLGELYSQIKNCHDRDPYNEMEVSFTSKLEF
jgi:hypothetical protein|tara:strand:+ start:172 stop:405 length:234 start_codon:yes stop_codon:yes gene_type:complete